MSPSALPRSFGMFVRRYISHTVNRMAYCAPGLPFGQQMASVGSDLLILGLYVPVVDEDSGRDSPANTARLSCTWLNAAFGWQVKSVKRYLAIRPHLGNLDVLPLQSRVHSGRQLLQSSRRSTRVCLKTFVRCRASAPESTISATERTHS